MPSLMNLDLHKNRLIEFYFPAVVYNRKFKLSIQENQLQAGKHNLKETLKARKECQDTWTVYSAMNYKDEKIEYGGPCSNDPKVFLEILCMSNNLKEEHPK